MHRVPQWLWHKPGAEEEKTPPREVGPLGGRSTSPPLPSAWGLPAAWPSSGASSSGDSARALSPPPAGLSFPLRHSAGLPIPPLQHPQSAHTCDHNTPGVTQAEPAQCLLVHPELLGPSPAHAATACVTAPSSHTLAPRAAPDPSTMRELVTGPASCSCQEVLLKCTTGKLKPRAERQVPVCATCTSAPAPGRRSSPELCQATPPLCQQIWTKRTCLRWPLVHGETYS